MQLGICPIRYPPIVNLLPSNHLCASCSVNGRRSDPSNDCADNDSFGVKTKTTFERSSSQPSVLSRPAEPVERRLPEGRVQRDHARLCAKGRTLIFNKPYHKYDSSPERR